MKAEMRVIFSKWKNATYGQQTTRVQSIGPLLHQASSLEDLEAIFLLFKPLNKVQCYDSFEKLIQSFKIT